MDPQISKEIQSAIDVLENVVVTLGNLQDEITSNIADIAEKDQQIEERDKVIADQEQEIIDLKEQLMSPNDALKEYLNKRLE